MKKCLKAAQYCRREGTSAVVQVSPFDGACGGCDGELRGRLVMHAEENAFVPNPTYTAALKRREYCALNFWIDSLTVGD